jgi:hypothetical protein
MKTRRQVRVAPPKVSHAQDIARGALLLIFWFKRGRIEWNWDARPLMPCFALAIAAGSVTAWVERNYI